jgi:hypothetical protein
MMTMNDVRPVTPVEHARAFAQQYVGLRIQDQSRSVERTVTYDDLVQAFADAAESAVDEFIRNQREKAEYIDVHEGPSDDPEEQSETPDRISAQSIIIRFMNGTEEVIHTHHPMVENGGWTFRNLSGVPYLVIGHGVPRRQYPACNIAFIELSGELL